MRRRDFLAAVGGVATWSSPTRAQQRRVPTIGYLDVGTIAANRRENMDAFLKGLAETGYVEGRNVTFEYREAKGDVSLLPELARDLVRRQVDVILSPGSGLAARAAMAETSTIPIVFSFAGNPLQAGLVKSLSHPGGNVTGVADFGVEISAKRLEMIKLLLPAVSVVGYLAVPGRLTTDEVADVTERGRTLGIDVLPAWVNTVGEIDAAFATFAERRVDAVSGMSNVLFFGNRERVIGLAARWRLPTMYPFIQYTLSGGLMSYGASVTERTYQVGIYVGQILNGQKPADLPVRRFTKFELAINMTTAKALGLMVPAHFLALADKVIE
jgi:putative tryptophan/tyrosine transport system substrate-binding protein